MTRARYNYKGEAIARHPALGARSFVVVFCQDRRLARAQYSHGAERMSVYPLASRTPIWQDGGGSLHVPCRRHPEGHALDAAELARLVEVARGRHRQISVSVSRVSARET